MQRLRDALEDGERGLPAGDDHRVAAPAPGGPVRRPPPDQGPGRRRARAARRDRRDAGDLARPHPRRRLPRALRLPARALPRGRAPRPTPGSPSAAASAAASAAPSPSSRCGSCCARILTRCELRKAEPEPERVARRNITLSPQDGTPVVLTARHPARERERSPPRLRPAALRAPGARLAQRAMSLEPEITSPSSRTRIGTSLVPLSSLTSARSSSRLPQVQGISR